jgi:hypothetical protein
MAGASSSALHGLLGSESHFPCRLWPAATATRYAAAAGVLGPIQQLVQVHLAGEFEEGQLFPLNLCHLAAPRRASGSLR